VRLLAHRPLCVQAVPAMFGGGIGTAFAIRGVQALLGMR